MRQVRRLAYGIHDQLAGGEYRLPVSLLDGLLRLGAEDLDSLQRVLHLARREVETLRQQRRDFSEAHIRLVAHVPDLLDSAVRRYCEVVDAHRRVEGLAHSAARRPPSRGRAGAGLFFVKPELLDLLDGSLERRRSCGTSRLERLYLFFDLAPRRPLRYARVVAPEVRRTVEPGADEPRGMVVFFAQKPLQVSPGRVAPRLEVVVLVIVEAADVCAYLLELDLQQPYCSFLSCLLIVHVSILTQKPCEGQQELRSQLVFVQARPCVFCNSLP
jgi:hypothetical protein